MANPEHLDILKQGMETWNQWRRDHTDILQPDLTGANLTGADLSDANLGYVYLSGANLSGANLSRAYLRMASLHKTDLSKANLSTANLEQTYLVEANLDKARLSKANLSTANLSQASLKRAILVGTNCQEAWFKEANLIEASLDGANLSYANFNSANLSQANLSSTCLVDTDLTNADLTDCRVYGIAAWDVHLEGAKQLNLIITPSMLLIRDSFDGNREDGVFNYRPYDGSTITVDNLKIAQFLYLLLNNAEIRDAIDTIARKAVLILGRFTPERKAVLDALREALRIQGYLPIVFDFDKPSSQDLTETVTTLAHLSRFIIADLTDPSSIPYELHAVIPNRMVPVLPLLKVSIDPITETHIPEFAMFRDLRKKYHWVLPIHTYKDLDDLLASFEAKVIGPAEQKAQEIVGSDIRLGSSDTHTMSP